MAPELKDCDLVKTFFTRFGVLGIGAVFYVIYTWYRMRTGYDQRSFAEFLAMFFNLGAHQAIGGIMLLLYSMHQDGLEPIAWYSATFDFEFMFTMLYIKFVKATFTPPLFRCYHARSGVLLFLGQVGDEAAKFRWSYFWVQFFVSVCVVGVVARALSIATVSVLQLDFFPFDVVYALAAFYAYLPLTCDGEAMLALYIKPALIDALTFTLSDWLLSSGKGKREKPGSTKHLI